MSYGVKLTLFLLAFNIIGFAEGYLLHELGLQWLLPIILVTAFGAVLLSRRFFSKPAFSQLIASTNRIQSKKPCVISSFHPRLRGSYPRRRRFESAHRHQTFLTMRRKQAVTELEV